MQFMKILHIIILNIFFITLNAQVIPYEEPKSLNIHANINFIPIDNILNKKITLSNSTISGDFYIFQLGINAESKNLRQVDLSIDGINSTDKIYIVDGSDYNTFIGPYYGKNKNILTNPIYTDKIIIEINSKSSDAFDIIINDFIEPDYKSLLDTDKIYYKKTNTRDEPIILLTGYWPPTNEMIRHFSQNENLNPQGWQGSNWENRGYDIISYFPEFSPPDCSSCGQGSGDIEVDYQDTSEDFWPIANNHSPLGIITFSRGYIDLSWEMEFNAYNRTNWYNDFTPPFLPTPNPPDTNEESFFLRNSNLPMDEIVEAINNLNLGLTPYIDFNGDPGHYVSEFMAYHGTWYRDLNQFEDEGCIAAGHIHVGGNIEWDTAKLATEESIRVLINYLDSFSYTPGDLNQDDITDILDLVIVINAILGQTELSNLQNYAADINEDSIINIQDIILMINIILN